MVDHRLKTTEFCKASMDRAIWRPVACSRQPLTSGLENTLKRGLAVAVLLQMAGCASLTESVDPVDMSQDAQGGVALVSSSHAARDDASSAGERETDVEQPSAKTKRVIPGDDKSSVNLPPPRDPLPFTEML